MMGSVKEDFLKEKGVKNSNPNSPLLGSKIKKPEDKYLETCVLIFFLQLGFFLNFFSFKFNQ